MSSSFPLKSTVYNSVWMMCPGESGYNDPFLVRQGDPWTLVTQKKICAPVRNIVEQKPVLWSGSVDALKQVRMLVGAYGWLRIRSILWEIFKRKLQGAPLPGGEIYTPWKESKNFKDFLHTNLYVSLD